MSHVNRSISRRCSSRGPAEAGQHVRTRRRRAGRARPAQCAERHALCGRGFGDVGLHAQVFLELVFENQFRRLRITAAARGLTDGAAVRVFNELGEVRCNLQVGSSTRPGTVMLPKGLWHNHTENGYPANALAPDTLTDLGGRARFNDACVQVELAPAQCPLHGAGRVTLLVRCGAFEAINHRHFYLPSSVRDGVNPSCLRGRDAGRPM